MSFKSGDLGEANIASLFFNQGIFRPFQVGLSSPVSSIERVR